MADSQQIPETRTPSPKGTRRRRWAVVALVALILCGWFGRFAYLRITLRPTPRPEYWEAKLAALDPAPPGAISAAKAHGLITSRPWENDPALAGAFKYDVNDILAGPWDENRPDIAAVTKVFESDAFKNARAAMRDAVEAGWQDQVSLRPPIAFPSYVDYRWWARWLADHSRWAREHNQDTAATVEDWLITVKLIRQLRRQPVLIAILVKSAIDSLVAREMMLAAREGTDLVDTARLLDDLDAVLGPALSPRDFMMGERIHALSNIDYVFVREGGDWLAVSDLAEMTATYTSLVLGAGGRAARCSRLWNLASPLFHDIQAARGVVNRYYDAFGGSLLVAGQRLQERAWHQKDVSPPDVLDGCWADYIPDPASVHKQLTFYYAGRSQLEAAVTMFALEEYRREHGKYPQELEELIPAHLPRLPIDCFGSQPLRYRPLDDDYLLYSVGSNGKDDGGRAGPRSVQQVDRPDIVFSQVERWELDR